jgi:hypothetical protein
MRTTKEAPAGNTDTQLLHRRELDWCYNCDNLYLLDASWKDVSDALFRRCNPKSGETLEMDVKHQRSTRNISGTGPITSALRPFFVLRPESRMAGIMILQFMSMLIAAFKPSSLGLIKEGLKRLELASPFRRLL